MRPWGLAVNSWRTRSGPPGLNPPMLSMSIRRIVPDLSAVTARFGCAVPGKAGSSVMPVELVSVSWMSRFLKSNGVKESTTVIVPGVGLSRRIDSPKSGPGRWPVSFWMMKVRPSPSGPEALALHLEGERRREVLDIHAAVGEEVARLLALLGRQVGRGAVEGRDPGGRQVAVAGEAAGVVDEGLAAAGVGPARDRTRSPVRPSVPAPKPTKAVSPPTVVGRSTFA